MDQLLDNFEQIRLNASRTPQRSVAQGYQLFILDCLATALGVEGAERPDEDRYSRVMNSMGLNRTRSRSGEAAKAIVDMAWAVAGGEVREFGQPPSGTDPINRILNTELRAAMQSRDVNSLWGMFEPYKRPLTERQMALLEEQVVEALREASEGGEQEGNDTEPDGAGDSEEEQEDSAGEEAADEDSDAEPPAEPGEEEPREG